MLPTPAKTGPDGALSINIDNESMGDIGKAFSIALKPLVKSIDNLNSTLIKSMAPDPESKTDRGKDLIKEDVPKKQDGEKMAVGKFGFAGLAVLAAALTGTTKELQGIVNTFAFPKTLKLLKAPFIGLKKGFNGLSKLFKGISTRFQNADLRKTFGKAGSIDKFLLSMKRVGESIGDLGKNIKGRIGGFFKGGVIDKFFQSTKNMTDGIKKFSPSALKTQIGFGKGGGIDKFFSATSKVADRVKDFLTPVKNVLSRIKKVIEPLKKIGGGLGSLLKPLMPLVKTIFFPITIIMGIIDGIKGFIEGYKDQGFIDGLLTGLGNILGGIVGAPLDLVKNLAAFLLEKLGFENVAAALKDFSFKEMIKNAFGGIANFFANLPEIVEGAVRAIPGIGPIAADLIFGKSKEKKLADVAEKTDKVQKSAQDDIDMAKKREKAYDREQEGIDKLKPGSRKDELQKRLDKKRQKNESKLLEAEGEKSEAVVKGLAAKTATVDTAKMFAKGASEEQVLEATAKLQETLTPDELEMFLSEIKNQSGLALEDLAKDSVQKKSLVGGLVGKKGLTDEEKKLQEDLFVGKAQLERSGKDQIEAKAKMVEGKVVEGETLDDLSAPIVRADVGGSSTDNSQNDNSQNTTNNKQEVHYHGGDGGDGFNSSNPSNSLYNSQTTYGM